jgi:hypothetical protein
VPHSWLRLESSVRIPSEAVRDKVDKEVVFRFQDLSESASGWSTAFTLGIDKWTWRAGRICHMSYEIPCESVVKAYRRRASFAGHG